MSKIQWTGATWNPIVGCSIPTLPSTGKPRAGCLHCYACKDSPHRFASKYDRDGVVVLRGKATRPGMTFVPRTPEGKSLRKGAQWTGEIRLLPWALDVPLRRRVPTTYFVNSLSDLFHESLVDCEEGRRFIAAIFGVMAACPQHTFQILTKRPHKAREWFAWIETYAAKRMIGYAEACDRIASEMMHGTTRFADECEDADDRDDLPWPLPNVWIGTSVEDQASADWAIPELLRVPAALRFLSVEPLLGPIDVAVHVPSDDGIYTHTDSLSGVGIGWLRALCGSVDYEFGRPNEFEHIDWVIVGGESGAGARECEVDWIRSIVAQCKAAGVPAFVKQLGAEPVFPVEECRACDGEGVSPEVIEQHDDACTNFRSMDFEDDMVRCAGCSEILVRCPSCADYSPGRKRPPRLADKKGGDIEEWPEDLRVREMPT